MNRVRALLACVVSLGLLHLGGLVLFCEDSALVQPQDVALTVRNAVIDCSTNSAFADPDVKKTFIAAGGHIGVQNTQCIVCHKVANPIRGNNDIPVATQGTALVHNQGAKPVTYEYKYGKGPEKTATLAAGEVMMHAWQYDKPGQNRSPEVNIKFDGPNGPLERPLTLVATPRPKVGALGAVHIFVEDGKGFQLRKPNAKITRN